MIRNKRMKGSFTGIVFLLNSLLLAGQDTRTQYPPGLKNAYFGVNIGYINYPFSSAQLEPGNNVENVSVPHTAVRIVLYGYSFSENLSARITYMRPVRWVKYSNVNGDKNTHTVWMNIAGLTLNGRIPLHKKIFLSAEAGLGIITRKGFSINNQPIIKDATYATGLFGGALQYHINNKWDLQFSTAWSPAHGKVKQPHTLFLGAGFNYQLRPLPTNKVETNVAGGYIFPKHFLVAGFTSNALGYGVNDFVSKKGLPIFWGGDVHVKQGFSAIYQRNIFHTRKVFAFDWSMTLGFWKSRGSGNPFFTVALNPIVHFNFLRTKPADIFFEYSAAGPAYISKTDIDGWQTGKKFTFHDFMGLGVFAGKQRNMVTGLRIAHFSNGNIFPHNDGVMIPLTLYLGFGLK